MVRWQALSPLCWPAASDDRLGRPSDGLEIHISSPSPSETQNPGGLLPRDVEVYWAGARCVDSIARSNMDMEAGWGFPLRRFGFTGSLAVNSS